MSEQKKFRLVFRVPSHVQTGPDTWQDTTSVRTADISMPDELEQLINAPWGAVLIGGHVVQEKTNDR